MIMSTSINSSQGVADWEQHSGVEGERVAEKQKEETRVANRVAGSNADRMRCWYKNQLLGPTN